MLQIIVQLLTLTAAAPIAYIALRASRFPDPSGMSAFGDLGWFLDRTPALDAFYMFVLQTALVVSTAAGSLVQVSNHVILTLDILFLLSALMLVLYHFRKEACNPSIFQIAA